jgi:two-component SAPR family response regulator
MKVIAVDDDVLSLEIFEAQLQEISCISKLDAFTSPNKALAFAAENPVDVAFLDINMRELDGITLAERLQAINAATRIVFITSHSEFALSAHELHASGYLIKPASLEKIEKTLDYILLPPPSVSGASGLKVRCFGNFEVFYKNEPLRFQRSKTKELFAYLIDRRGASVNTGELTAVLWDSDFDNQSQKNQLRVLISDLSRTLRAINAEHIFRKRRDSYSIDPAGLDCDFFRYIDCVPGSGLAFNGEYMSQYSWAEYTLAYLYQIEKKASG